MDLADLEPPDGWDRVVADTNGLVMAGWTSAGDFHAYVRTETIVSDLLDALDQISQLPQEHP